MTKFYVDYNGSGATTPPVPWSYNSFGSGWDSAGVLTAALVDDTNTPSSYGLEIVSPYDVVAGSNTWADTDSGGWDFNVFRNALLTTNGGTSSQKVTGLNVGDDYTVEIAGHSFNASRDSDITVNGSTLTYDNTASTTPSAPLSFSGTVPAGGEILISTTLAAVGGQFYGHTNGFTIEVTAAVVSPTIDGPTSATEGVSVQFTGTDLDTATTAGFKSGSWKVTNTIDAQTAGTLDLVPDLGTPTLITPVASMPVTPTVTAAGITPHVLESWVNDGVNPDGEFTLTTLSAGANDEVVQYMIATSNITEGQSVLAPSIMPTLEDDAQFIAPKTQNGVTYTWSADGTVETDKDQSETLSIVYFSLATGQRSLAASVTVQGTSITGGGISIKSSIKSSIKRSIVR